MKLTNLLNELTAAEKAHQQGLKSAGYDKWEKDGKVVARTVNGELVPIDHDEPSSSEPAPKPTTMSAADAGTKPSNTVTPTDAAQTAGNAPEKKPEGKAKDGEEAPHVAPRNNLGIQPFPVGRPMEDYDLPDHIAPAVDPHELTKVINTDEEAYILDGNDWDAYFLCHPVMSGIINRQEIVQMGQEAAKRQNDTWRRNLPHDIQVDLMHIQHRWQDTNQYDSDPDIKAERNAFINLLAAGKSPATLEGIQFPLERGMAMSPEIFKDFIKEFAVDKDIDMPPSGFSTNPMIARGCADRTARDVGVLLRLAPTRYGKVHGIALTEVDIPESLQFHEVADFQKLLRAEQEVIRPSGPKAHCTSIRKLIQLPGPNSFQAQVKVCYVIELEERGYPKEELDEVRVKPKKKDHNVAYLEIMNTPVRFKLPSMSKYPVMEGKLRRLIALLEGKASDQAHKLGLIYKGHGYWGDKSGKTVAKTIDDTLVKATDADHSGKPLNPNDTWDEHPFPSQDLPIGSKNWKNAEPYAGAETKSTKDNICAVEIGGQAGSNPGGVYKGKDNIARYVKFYNDPAQAYGEVLANNLYHDLGIEAPEAQYFDYGHNNDTGKVGFASVIMANKGQLKGQLNELVAHKILNGYMADCLVGNWDVVGLVQDNIVLGGKGEPIRIDNGGSFLMRAQAGRKEDKFLNTCSEFDFFPKAQYAPIFKAAGLTNPRQLGVKAVAQMEDILGLVTKYGGWENYVAEKVPDLQGPDRDKIIAMLYHRTKALIEFTKECIE